MDFLQSFSLRDLLIFSPESYFKLFEISNKALWPLHIPLALLAIAAVILLFKRPRYTSQLIFIWLALVWSFVGYTYFGMYYRQISTYSHYISYAFWAEACLLFIFALLTRNEPATSLKTTLKSWRLILGSGFILYGLLFHPIVSLFIWNQPLVRFEFFSIAPDPTAITTIGFVLLLPIRGNLILLAIPILCLLLSFITYQAF